MSGAGTSGRVAPAARPRLHFTAAHGWINDPLGLTWHDGVYHLFFQYVPGRTTWAANCHWGHATSPDLLRWTQLPVALAPGDGDDGCWSGCVVTPPDGDAVMFYTAVRSPDLAIGTVRTARPDDPDWQRWTKRDVVAAVPADVGLSTFRDPFVFRDADRWRMLVGAARPDGIATALVYTSVDLATWEYTGALAERPGAETAPIWTGTMWECPQLVPFGDRSLLVVSVFDSDVLYYVAGATGRYADGRFEVERWYRLSYGPAPYAPSLYRDDRDRPGLIAWLRGITEHDAWAGALSVPTLLDLDRDGRPTLEPHPNLAARRQATAVDGWAAGAAVDAVWSPRPGAANTLLISDADGAALVELAAADQVLTVTAASAATDGDSTMPWPGGDIRLLLDGPVLEVFCGGALLATAVHPEHQRLTASADGGPGECEAWTLQVG